MDLCKSVDAASPVTFDSTSSIVSSFSSPSAVDGSPDDDGSIMNVSGVIPDFSSFLDESGLFY
jgi:hypothetical protein